MKTWMWIALAVVAATIVYYLYKRKKTADASISLDDYMAVVFGKNKSG